jgi:hypothetical protein
MFNANIMMMKPSTNRKRCGIYVDRELWQKFLEATVKYKGKVAISECVEEAIKLWLRKQGYK